MIRSPARLGGLLPALALLLPAGLAAQAFPVAEAPAPGPWSGAVDEARALVDAVMDSVHIPGVSVAVAVDGDVVWAEGFGFADLEHRVGVHPETKFRIGSVSKSLTAAALGILHEEGRLDLDAPVQLYVPSFPEKEHPISTRQVAGHLAGIRHYRGEEFLSTEQYDDVVDALVVFRDDPLQSVPGEEYAYSSYGWNLISAVIQGAAGEPFLHYMRRAVLEPLGLESTVAEHVDSILPHRTGYYQRGDDGAILNAPFVNNSVKWAGGGYLSTARDMVVYGSAHLDGRLMDPETVEMLWRSQTTSDGEPTGYGIGWRDGEHDGRREVSHTGGSIGGSTVLLIYPEERVVVAVFSNIGGAPNTLMGRGVASLFMEPVTTDAGGAP